MPAPTFRERELVQNVFSTSQYYGQVGRIQSIKSTTNGPRYVVLWANGEAATYRGESLIAARVPEKDFLKTDSGWRKGKKITRHEVPPSPRPALV
jgi:hypothetical protein